MRIPTDFPGQRALAGAGITSFGELDPLTDAELLEINGIAEKTVQAIREARVTTGGVLVPVEITREWWLRGEKLKVGERLPLPRSAVEAGLAANPPHVKVLDG